jgi:hypothetical protein
MTRTAWVLLLALILSNAVWVGLSFRGTAPDAPTSSAKREDRDPRKGEPAPESTSGANVGRPAAGNARPEETPAAPGEDTRQEEPPLDPAEAQRLADAWIADARQTDDPARRAAAIERIRQALQSDSPLTALAGLLALHQISSLRFDKAPFREPVLALLRSPDAGTRAAALRALPGVEAQPEDIQAILPCAGDPAPEVRRQVAGALFRMSSGNLAPDAEEAYRGLIADKDRRVSTSALAFFPPDPSKGLVEQALVLARQEQRHPAVLRALQGLSKKESAVVDVLLEALKIAEPVQASSVIIALRRGLVPEDRGRVADAILVKMRDSSSLQVQRAGLDTLRMTAEGRHAREIEALLRDGHIGKALSTYAQDTVSFIQRRAGR